MGIIDRILAGACVSEINIHNATSIMDWVRDTDSHHDAKGCKKKNCIHAPRPMDVAWAAALANEAQFVCTCGEHGTNEPEKAKAIVQEFRKEW